MTQHANDFDKHHFIFKPVERSQVPIIHDWLNQDYIREWIHGAGLQNTHNGLSKFIAYYEQEQKIDRQSTLTQYWLGYDKEIPFVLLCTSNVFDNEDSIYSQHKGEGVAITLDIFIVNKDYLGKGLAVPLIQSFLINHFADVSEVFIDPEQRNQRAVYVYQKVDFEIIGDFIASWHPVPHYLMKLDMNSLLVGD